MTDEVKNTPEQEEKKSPEVPTEEKKEETVGEVIQQQTNKDEAKPEVVGLDKFLDIKNQVKEQKKIIKDLETRLASGETAEEISEDIDAIADEYPDVSKSFLKKLVNAVKKESEKSFEAKYAPKLKSLEDKETSEKIDRAFSGAFNKAIDSMPEYKDIVNAEVIKALSLDPRNSKKTFPQLIEETYGRAIVGKRTIEQTRPHGGKEPDSIDFDRAKKDGKYFTEIMADPDLRKEYNSSLISRLGY